MTTKRVGRAIDTWKLDIFIRHLTSAGYAYEQSTLTADMFLLRVQTDDLIALGIVVKAANDEAASFKKSN